MRSKEYARYGDPIAGGKIKSREFAGSECPPGSYIEVIETIYRYLCQFHKMIVH
jgi:hypothetical protein